MTIAKILPQITLQSIFDNNGLDSFSTDSNQLNHDALGNVIIDDVLYNYLTPFNCLFDEVFNNSK